MVENMIITIAINAFKRNMHFCRLNEHVTDKSIVYRPSTQSKYTHSLQAHTRGNLVSCSRGKDHSGCLTCRLTVTHMEFNQYVPISFFSIVAQQTVEKEDFLQRAGGHHGGSLAIQSIRSQVLLRKITQLSSRPGQNQTGH